MAIIRLPTPLRPYANGQAEVPVAGGTVSAVLDGLVSSYPALRPHLLDNQGQLRPYVNLFLGENNVMDNEGLATTVKEGDRLLLIPSIAGGYGEEQHAAKLIA
jgi:sulfur-carrier protein